MERTLKFMDLVTLTGMITAIGGIFLCLFLLFHPFKAGATVPEATTGGVVDLEISMRWIQPILGRGIVEDALIKQQYGDEIRHAIKIPDRGALAAYLLNGGDPQRQALVYAAAMGADHAARVQWVMGRLIVELTRHSVRAGMGAADPQAEAENRRILTIAQEARKKLDDGFKTEWQTKLGRGIVSQTLNQVRTVEQSRDRVGLIF